MNYQKNINHPERPKGKRWYQMTPDILLDDEIELLLQEAINHSYRDYTLILFALSTGLRNTEVIGLNVENVYPFSTVVNVLELPAEIAKGKKPRKIPLNKEIRKVLDVYIDNCLRYKKNPDSVTPLFRSKWSNKRLGPRDFQQILRRHAFKSLNHPCNPHMLRHTFATKLLSQSNIKIVQDLLGHTCIQSTQIYLHPSSSEKSDAVNKLNFTHKRKE